MLKKKATPTTTTTRRVRIPDKVVEFKLPQTESDWRRWKPPEKDDTLIVLGVKGVWSYFQLYLCAGLPDQVSLIPYPDRGLKGGERVKNQQRFPISQVKRVLSWKEVAV